MCEPIKPAPPVRRTRTSADLVHAYYALGHAGEGPVSAGHVQKVASESILRDDTGVGSRPLLLLDLVCSSHHARHPTRLPPHSRFQWT